MKMRWPAVILAVFHLWCLSGGVYSPPDGRQVSCRTLPGESCEVPAWAIGVFAMTGVLMSSYLGTQAQAVGLKRNYGGILGRADRLVLLMVFGAVEVVFPSPLFLGLPALGWLLVIFGVFGHVTAVQRFVSGWRELNAPRKE